MKLLFATNNIHKLSEAKYILRSIEVLGLKDANVDIDIPEDYETLKENALQKARFIYQMTGMNVIADDTGLEIESLNGRPGVYSARYAGEGCSFEDNVKKVLKELKGIENRNAAFVTVVALIVSGQEYFFRGEVCGRITETSSCVEGFGYDPVFIPDGYDQTFAQMPASLKNSISHRAIAFQKVGDFLKED